MKKKNLAGLMKIIDNCNIVVINDDEAKLEIRNIRDNLSNLRNIIDLLEISFEDLMKNLYPDEKKN